MKRLQPWLFGILILSSCAKKETEKIIEYRGQDTFGLVSVAKNSLHEEERLVAVDKASLNSPYLLGLSFIRTIPSGMGTTFANKVVFFEKQGDSLYMFEFLAGQVITDAVESRVLLAQFPIIHESGDHIIFDFSEGMEQVFIRGSYGSANGQRSSESVMQITQNFVNRVERRGTTYLIEQSVRIDTNATASSPSTNIAAHFKFSLTPYETNSEFSPRLSSELQRVGHFETGALTMPVDGSQVRPMFRFDSSKPIVFHLTPNIPEKHRQAVIDGVLYWNHQFADEEGQLRVEVATLPSGVSTHDPGYNVVQWVESESAGSAYADFSADPLTGELLQANVYMPASFAIGGMESARSIFERMIDHDHDHDDLAITLPGFGSIERCEHAIQDSLMPSFQQLLELRKSQEFMARFESEEEREVALDEIFLRVANDYIREVMAHEIGHALGLRHNFAGSLMSTIEHDQSNEVSLQYMLTGDIPEGAITTGSVMDYSPLLESAIAGAHIRLNRGLLPYDEQALRFAYAQDISFEDIKALPFCTDDHRRNTNLVDCQIWDRGKEPFQERFHALKEGMAQRAKILALGLADEQTPTAISQEVLDNISLNPDRVADWIIDNLYKPLVSLTHLDADFIGLSYDRAGEAARYFQRDSLRSDIREFQRQEIGRLGGLGEALITPFQLNSKGHMNFKNDFMSSFQENIEQLYPDTPQELQDQALNMAKDYWVAVESELLKRIPTAFPSSHQFAVTDQSWFDELQTFLSNLLYSKNMSKPLGLNSLGHIVYEWRHGQGVRERSPIVRERALSMVRNNLQTSSPSYRRELRGIINLLTEKRTEWEKRILGDLESEENLTDELYDLLIIERELHRNL
jgi:hypothetical protein